MKSQITQMLRDRIDEKDNSQSTPTPETADNTAEGGSTYDKIANILNNEIVNTAAICKVVFGDNEASNRSLFGKKLNREPNDNGSIYHFDEAELLKISNALMNFSSQIRKSIGRQGKG